MLYKFASDLSSIRENYERFDKINSDKEVIAQNYIAEKEKSKASKKPQFTEVSEDEALPVNIPNNDLIIAPQYKDPQSAKSDVDASSRGIKAWGESLPEEKEGLKFGSSEAMQSVGLAGDIGSTFSRVSGSQSEGWANSMKLGGKAFQLGNSVGGPLVGAAAGIIGFGAGVIDTFSDIKKRNEIARNKIDKDNNKRFTDLEIEGARKQNESSVQKLMDLKQKQINYIPKF